MPCNFPFPKHTYFKGMKSQASFISGCNITIYVAVFPETSPLIKGGGLKRGKRSIHESGRPSALSPRDTAIPCRSHPSNRF